MTTSPRVMQPSPSLQTDVWETAVRNVFPKLKLITSNRVPIRPGCREGHSRSFRGLSQNLMQHRSFVGRGATSQGCPVHLYHGEARGPAHVVPLGRVAVLLSAQEHWQPGPQASPS